jgi:hypothetical protein
MQLAQALGTRDSEFVLGRHVIEKETSSEASFI